MQVRSIQIDSDDEENNNLHRKRDINPLGVRGSHHHIYEELERKRAARAKKSRIDLSPAEEMSESDEVIAEDLMDEDSDLERLPETDDSMPHYEPSNKVVGHFPHWQRMPQCSMIPRDEETPIDSFMSRLSL